MAENIEGACVVVENSIDAGGGRVYIRERQVVLAIISWAFGVIAQIVLGVIDDPFTIPAARYGR